MPNSKWFSVIGQIDDLKVTHFDIGKLLERTVLTQLTLQVFSIALPMIHGLCTGTIGALSIFGWKQSISSCKPPKVSVLQVKLPIGDDEPGGDWEWTPRSRRAGSSNTGVDHSSLSALNDKTLAVHAPVPRGHNV